MNNEGKDKVSGSATPPDEETKGEEKEEKKEKKGESHRQKTSDKEGHDYEVPYEENRKHKASDAEFASWIANYLMDHHSYITRASNDPERSAIYVMYPDKLYRPDYMLYSDAMRTMEGIVERTDPEALDFMPRDVDFPEPKPGIAKNVVLIIKGMTAVEGDFFDENPEHIPVNNGILEFFDTKRSVIKTIREREEEALIKAKDPKVKERAQKIYFEIPDWDLKVKKRWNPHLEPISEVTIEDVKRGAKVFGSKIPVDYDPTADCPAFKKFLEEVLPDKGDRMAIQELFGSLLWRASVGKAFVLIGEGANGKSTLLKVMETFLDKENIATRSLQDISRNRFAVADLVGKLANFGYELPSSRLENSDVFKSLVTGDSLPAEKKFEHPFPFHNYAKLIFATNQMPSFADTTTAFYRRWVIINFPNRFLPAELIEEAKQRLREANPTATEEEIEEQTKNLKVADPFILEKITTPQELSGVLNWALEGLRRLLNNKFKFTSENIPEETGEEMERMVDPIKAFLNDETEITNGSEDYVAKDDLYNAYTAYCRRKKLPMVGYNTFFKRLRMVFNYSEFQPRTLGRKRAVMGIKLNEGEEEQNSLTQS